MSIQFENVKDQTSGIRAWGNLGQDTIVVQVRISPGLDCRTTKTGKWVFHRGKHISDFVDNSDVGISDIYWKQDGKWLAKFGTIKSMCGLSNKEIGKLVQRLQENGKFSGDMDKSQWEDIIIENGELIFVDDWKDVEPVMFVVEQSPENIEGQLVRMPKTTKIPEKYPEDSELTPENMDEFDSWLDEIIGIIGEVSEATPEQLRKLGAVLDTLGKELEDAEEEESVVEELEDDDEEEERLTSEIMEEIKKGNKPLIDFFTKIMETPKEVIETPVKPNESHIANKIMEDAGSKKQETQQAQKSHRGFLDKILDEIEFGKPMSWKETQKRWEETWKDMGKEWARHKMDHRHRGQKRRSKWDLFRGLSGKTPPWFKF